MKIHGSSGTLIEVDRIGRKSGLPRLRSARHRSVSTPFLVFALGIGLVAVVRLPWAGFSKKTFGRIERGSFLLLFFLLFFIVT